MGLSLANLRAEFLAHTGLETSDFDNGNTDIDLIINRSWWEIMDKLDFREKEASDTYTTEIGENTYTITELFGSTSIFDAIREVTLNYNNKQYKLNQMTLAVFNENYNSDEGEYAMPTHYIRDGSNMILWPTPDLEYNLTLYFQQVLSDIPSAGPDVPQSWDEIVLYGAVWRGFMRMGDYNRSAAAKKIQLTLIDTSTPVKAKELMDNPKAALQPLGREY